LTNNHASPALIQLAAKQPGRLSDRVTFLGGGVVCLLINDPAARPIRPTVDLDVAINLATRLEFYKLEDELRALGFTNDIRGPICRFLSSPLVIDIMPTDPDILGFANRWYRLAIESADRFELADGELINLITPACFLATKLEAFNSPTREGYRDMFSSKDFEDIIVLVDGRPGIVADVENSDPTIRAFVIEELKGLASGRYFREAVESHLDRDSNSSQRLPKIIERLSQIAGLNNIST
jgi:hypothetical protein